MITKMNWKEYQGLSDQWCEAVEKSAEDRNRFLKPMREERASGEWSFEPVEEVISLLRKANQEGETETFRKLFPPSHDLLVGELDRLGQTIANVVLTEDNTILFRVGNEKEEGCLYYIKNNQVASIPTAAYAGISKDKQQIGIAYQTDIRLYAGDGKQIQTFQWPEEAEENKNVYQVKSLIPFRNGKKILLVTVGGIFVLDPDGSSLLIHPQNEVPEHLDMVHGDVSPRDGLIAVGDQDSDHIVLDAMYGYEESEVIEKELSYADFALFNGDGSYVLMNSCQMYDGASVILGMDTDDVTDVELSGRFTAGTSWDKAFIVGDINGNLYSINPDGTWNWTYYVGSTVKGMDISRDGKKLIVGTSAGMLHLLQLEYEEENGEVKKITEVKRFAAWKGEETVYKW